MWMNVCRADLNLHSCWIVQYNALLLLMQKREKRVISNWTLLVKGLLIREKLKKRYSKKNQGLRTLADGQEPCGLSSDEEAGEGASPAAKTASETLAMSWPQNRTEKEEKDCVSGLQKKKITKREKRGQDKHLFPFEKAWNLKSKTAVQFSYIKITSHVSLCCMFLFIHSHFANFFSMKNTFDIETSEIICKLKSWFICYFLFLPHLLD